MERSRWKLGALAALAVAATAFVTQAQAVPTVTLNVTGATVEIVADGLPSAAGGFSLFLDYDASLTFSTYAVGGPPAAGPLSGTLGDFPFDLSFGDLGGTVDLVALADFLAAEPDLFAAQNSGGPFVLATVTFTGAIGTAPLGLRDVAISDFLGSTLLTCTGVACNPVATIPEPMTPLLIAAALGVLALRRKRSPLAA